MDSNYDEIWSPISRVYDPVANGSIDGTDTEPHDRAIIRALNSKYKPNAKVTGDPQCTIFIARLNHTTDESSLKQIFSKYGQIKQLRLVRDIITGASKGYAFVEYYDASIVDRVYQDAHRMIIDDKEILVDYVCARVMPGWIPRRLGGGLGGRKESGQLRFGCRDRPFRKPIYLSTDDYQAGVRHSKIFGRYGQSNSNQSELSQKSAKNTRSPERSRSNRDERSRPESRSIRDEDRSRHSSSEKSEEDRASTKHRRTKYRSARSEREKQIKIEGDGEAKYSGVSSAHNVLSSRKLNETSEHGRNIKHEVE